MRTIDKLKKYFPIKIIGSYLFVMKNLLKEEDINDIDIVVDNDNIAENIRLYLIDEGFNETEKPIKNPGYAIFKGSLFFKKDDELSIHILVDRNLDVLPLKSIFANKWERSTNSDIKQLFIILNNSK